MPLPSGPEVTTVAGGRDWLAPSHTTHLSGARHLDLPTGHSGLLVDEAVAEAVAQILDAPPAASTPASRPANRSG